MRNDTDIRFRLPTELKTEAQKFCDSNSVSVGAWLRALMRDSLGQGPPVPQHTIKRPKPVTLSDGTTLNR